MSHLTDERIFELGLDLAREPSHLEATHLDACADCRAALASERELSLALTTTLPREEPSPDFTTRTTMRFRAARATEAAAAAPRSSAVRARPSFRPVAWALLASFALAAPAVALLMKDAGPIVQYLVLGAKNVMVLISALALVASKVPLGWLFVAASSTTLVVGWSLAMGRIVSIGAREINAPAAA